MDDLIVFSRSVEEHHTVLDEILKTLAQYQILINEGKCQFFQTELKFLGHKLSLSGIEVTDKRIESIRDFPTPQSSTELERFLGICAYTHRFKHDVSQLTQPLHDIKKFKKVEEFKKVWTPEHDRIFAEAKKKISKNTKLFHMDWDSVREFNMQ